MEKKEAKTSSSLPKIISVLAVIVIIVTIFYVVTRTSVKLSTTDPANVVTKLSDLPSGWSENILFYRSTSGYASETLGYTGPLPEIGYYAGYYSGSMVFVSEAMRFSSADDANTFYDYLYGRIPAGAQQQPGTIGDRSVIVIVDQNIGGYMRKSNFVVVNASEGAFTLQEFTNYFQMCEGRISLE